MNRVKGGRRRIYLFVMYRYEICVYKLVSLFHGDIFKRTKEFIKFLISMDNVNGKKVYGGKIYKN